MASVASVDTFNIFWFPACAGMTNGTLFGFYRDNSIAGYKKNPRHLRYLRLIKKFEKICVIL